MSVVDARSKMARTLKHADYRSIQTRVEEEVQKHSQMYDLSTRIFVLKLRNQYVTPPKPIRPPNLPIAG